jgi:hypothetical protein
MCGQIPRPDRSAKRNGTHDLRADGGHHEAAVHRNERTPIAKRVSSITRR